MRRVRYQVATSLDGYIAGPKGEYDWIIHDPDIDFRELFAQFDTLLMGRSTYELTASAGPGLWPGMKVVVFSKTLSARDHPGVTIVADGMEETVNELRASRARTSGSSAAASSSAPWPRPVLWTRSSSP